MASIATLPQAATSILTAFASELGALGVKVPGTQYVSAGVTVLAAWDTEQLVVNLQEVTQGQPGQPGGGTIHPQALAFFAQFAVLLIRPVSILTGVGSQIVMTPAAASLNADGVMAIEDASAMTQAAINIYANQILEPIGMGFEIGPVNTIGPDGGYCGTRCLVTVSLA